MPNNVYDTEKRTCDRCGFDYKKSSLRKQRGMWLGHDCFDNLDKIQQPRPRWQSPRDDSALLTVPPESTSTVFTVSAGTGVDLISPSVTESDSRDGRHKSTFMLLVSDGGAITLTATPQIVGAAQDGDLLTLKGTSDTDTITLHNGDGIQTGLGRPFTLDDGNTISFVYTMVTIGWGDVAWGTEVWGGIATTDNVWVETSRFKGGF